MEQITENRCPKCNGLIDLERMIYMFGIQQWCECGNHFVFERAITVYTGDYLWNDELFHEYYVPLFSCLKCRRVCGGFMCRCMPPEEAYLLYKNAQKELNNTK